jgi:hypothetical protein
MSHSPENGQMQVWVQQLKPGRQFCNIGQTTVFVKKIDPLHQGVMIRRPLVRICFGQALRFIVTL